jgi:hypothetical protein
MIRRVPTVLVLVLLFPCGGCSHWQETGVRPDYFLNSSPTDRLRVTLSDGSRFVVNHPVAKGDTLRGWRSPLDLRGEQVSGVPDLRGLPPSPPSAVSREPVAVPLSEIVGSEVRKGDPGGTALLVTGIIAGSIGLLVVAVAASGGISVSY